MDGGQVAVGAGEELLPAHPIQRDDDDVPRGYVRGNGKDAEYQQRNGECENAEQREHGSSPFAATSRPHTTFIGPTSWAGCVPLSKSST